MEKQIFHFFFVFLKIIFTWSKREVPMEKDTIIFYLYIHDMPQSLLVFAVFFTSETPNFGTFGGVTHPP